MSSVLEQHFESLEDWKKFGPDLGHEYFPKFDKPTQTYQEWLRQYPDGITAVCSND